MKVNDWVRLSDKKLDQGKVGRVMAVYFKGRRVTVRWQDGKLLEHPYTELEVLED